jgi:hypothetical protein
MGCRRPTHHPANQLTAARAPAQDDETGNQNFFRFARKCGRIQQNFSFQLMLHFPL